MSKDPSLVRKALFSENNNGNSDSKWFISQSSLKHNHNAPKIGTLLIVIIAIAVFFKYAHLLSKYIFSFIMKNKIHNASYAQLN